MVSVFAVQDGTGMAYLLAMLVMSLALSVQVLRRGIVIVWKIQLW